MTKLLIGTQNPGKLAEIKTILHDIPFQLVSIREFQPLSTPTEDAHSYSGNAIIKAREYAGQTGILTLGDDSGLEVEALQWGPGVLSARYAGEDASDADRRALLLSNIEKTGFKTRKARFVCVVAIADPEGQVVSINEGVCIGQVSNEPRGQGGFGYDPLFVPDGYDLTFAELENSLKNEISHRGRALAKAREFLLTRSP